MPGLPLIARLSACLPMLAVAAYTLSFCSGRMVVVEGSVALLLLLPCLWAAATPWRRLEAGLAGWVVLAALALGGWMAAVQLLRQEALPAGWWMFAVRAAGLGTLLMLLAGGADARTLVRLGGGAAACALTVGAVMNGWLGVMHPLDTDCFGFGHINILVNTAGPALLAALVLVVADSRAGRRPLGRELAVLLVGALSLAVIVVVTQRRGVVLSAACGLSVLLVAWLYPRRRALALTLVAVGLLVGGISVVHQFAGATPGLRGERIQLYRAGVEGVLASLPWGFGHYGALHLQTVAGEAARHMTANGGYGEDVHNQLLEVALDGGPFALLLALAGLALVGWHVHRVSDPGLRPALQALAAAVLVHLVTDNIYGTEFGTLWFAWAVGTMLCAPSTASAPWLPSLAHRLPPLPLLCWPLAAVALWGALIDLHPALQSAGAGAADTFACLERARNPQAVGFYADRLLGAEDPWLDSGRREATLRLATGMMGWTTRTAIYEVDCAQRAHDPERALQAIVRVLTFSPCFHQYYEQLSGVIAAQPRLERLLPPTVRLRLAYLRGDPGLPRPDLTHPPATVGEAADLYAALSWAIANNLPWSEIERPLGELARRYGDLQGVAQLVAMAVCAAPERPFPWLGEVSGVLGVGLRTPGAGMMALAVASTPAQARALLPLAEQLYPTIIDDCRRGTLHPTSDAQWVALQTTVIRLWGRARLTPPAGPLR